MPDLSLPLTKFRVATKFNEIYLKNSSPSATQQELLEFYTNPCTNLLFFATFSPSFIKLESGSSASRHKGVWGLPIEHLLNNRVRNTGNR